MELGIFPDLIKMPDFSGLLKLETFKVYNCLCLEEIHPSIGSLESLVSLSIHWCPKLGISPFITRIKKLETLVFRHCCLGDEEIDSYFWELPNLEKLDLFGNSFSRLDFSNMRLPQLKWLDVSWCERLVELSHLPSSIAVVYANRCDSFKSFGDISNCKWLWNVSLHKSSKFDQHCAATLINSMLEGNAIEDHYINVVLHQHLLPNRRFRGNTFRQHLPYDWYNGFCGFLVFIVTNAHRPKIKITMKQEDPPYDLSHECDDAVEPMYESEYKYRTCVGYVSFSSLRHTKLLTSSYDSILVTIEGLDASDSDNESDDESSTYGEIELIPRKSKSDEVQTTDCSEFWDGKLRDAGLHPFIIQQYDSDSFVEISWNPSVSIK